MATVTKHFKIKYGLIVEGTEATINGNDILTKSLSDQNYIIGLIGGSATPLATPDTVVLRDGNADFSAHHITADLFIGDLDGEAGTVSSLSNHTTTGLAEGTQLYFTTSRARESIQSGTGINYDSSTGTVSIDTTTTATLSHVDGEILTALSTAQGYANTAESNAITAAALDATTKADTAEQDAKDYADALINDASTSSTEVWSAYKTSTEISLLDTAAQGYANAAESAANLYTDGAITTLDGLAQGYASTAEANANAYTDNAVSGLSWKQSVNLLANADVNMTGSTNTLVIDGHSALNSSDNNVYRILLTNQDIDAENGIYVYTDNGSTYTLVRAEDADVYSELIGAAVYVMEGTQYGSTSWVQGDHYITDFSGQDWTQFSGQGSVTAGTGITVNGLEVSVNRTLVDTWYDPAGAAAAAETAANLYTSGEITTALSTAQGYATTAENNAKNYSDDLVGDVTVDGTSGNTVTSRIAAAKSEAIAHADALTTSDVAEGTSLYFTTDRATDAAGALLAAAEKTNIQITYDNETNILTVSAENGVADSTTDDLDEGSTHLYFTNARAQSAVAGDIAAAINALDSDDIEEGVSHLYFTDQRAQDAVDGTTRSFTSININTYRTEEATQQFVASASTVTAHTFTGNKSVKYVVRTVGSEGGTLHSQVTELLATVDGNNNIAVTEYGTVHTSEDPLSTATADYSGGEFRLRVTTTIANAEVVAAATMMSWAD